MQVIDLEITHHQQIAAIVYETEGPIKVIALLFFFFEN